MTTDNHDAAGNKATLLVSYEVAKLFIELNNILEKLISSESDFPASLGRTELKVLLEGQRKTMQLIGSLDSSLTKWDIRTNWIVDVTQYERDLKLNGLL